jgi:CBS domain containing-hemolysin-like protein
MKLDIEFIVLASALFFLLISAWEALIQLSGGRARRLESKDRSLAKKVEGWVEHKSSYQTVFRFLSLFTVCFIAVGSFDIIKNYYHDKPFHMTLLVFIAVGLLFMLFTEISTRLIVQYLDVRILNITMPVIKVLRYSIFFPLVFITESIKNKSEEVQSKDGDEEKTTAEDEILSLVEHDSASGDDSSSLEEDEKRMIRGIFDLDNTSVREIMTPRVDVKALPIDSTIDDAIELITDSGHSRIPVFKGSIDHIEGILYAKDLLDRKKINNKELKSLLRKPIFVPETKEVGDLLEEIKKNRRHFVVVIDEYGGTAGIITLEDIIEEIVGEIRDEYDLNEDDTPMHSELPEGGHIFDARTLINDVNEILDIYLPDGDEVDTIGGLVCCELGHIPKSGEQLLLEDGKIEIKVLKSDLKRIKALKITIRNEDD